MQAELRRCGTHHCGPAAFRLLAHDAPHGPMGARCTRKPLQAPQRSCPEKLSSREYLRPSGFVPDANPLLLGGREPWFASFGWKLLTYGVGTERCAPKNASEGGSWLTKNGPV